MLWITLKGDIILCPTRGYEAFKDTIKPHSNNGHVYGALSKPQYFHVYQVELFVFLFYHFWFSTLKCPKMTPLGLGLEYVFFNIKSCILHLHKYITLFRYTCLFHGIVNIPHVHQLTWEYSRIPRGIFPIPHNKHVYLINVMYMFSQFIRYNVKVLNVFGPWFGSPVHGVVWNCTPWYPNWTR